MEENKNNAIEKTENLANKPEVKKTVKTQVSQKSNTKKQQTQTVTEQTAWEKFKAWVKSFKK
jgi:hypothetical protein